MDDDELRRRIAELRAKRGGGRAAGETAPVRREAEPPPLAPLAPLAPLPPAETYTVAGNGEYYRKGEAPPVRLRSPRREERRTEYRPPWGDSPEWNPAEPEETPRPKKEDGVWGVVTVQGILAAGLAIFYVVLLALAPASARFAADTVKEKSAHDFSFRDALCDMVGNAITTLNRLAPLPVEEAPPQSAPESAPQSAPPGGESEPAELDGVGGAYSPADGYNMPPDATFAPIVFTGSLVFPIAGGGRQTAIFGFRENPIYGGLEFHKAADIAAPKDTNILAAFDGVVAASGEDRYLGERILLDHGNGFFTVYGHCDRLLAKEGTRVRAGEVIAKVGSTGDSTGFHLHFGMKMDGLWFDPAWLYPGALASGGVEGD